MSVKTNILIITFSLFFIFFFSFQTTMAWIDYIQEWNYTANPSAYDDRAVGVAVDSKDNIIVVGYGRIPPIVPADFYWNITKLDKDGRFLWNYTYDNPGIDDRAVGVAVDSQDNFVVVGYDRNTSSSSDFEWRIIKFNSTNNKVWEIPYNITLYNDRPTGVAIDHDNNITVVGYYNASPKTNDYGWWIVKFDKDGNQLWNRSFNFTDYMDVPNGVTIDNDNYIIVVGYDNITSSGSIGWGIVKLDKNNNVFWEYHDDVSPYSDEAKSVTIDNDNNIIVVGYDRLPGLNDAEWRIMKFYPDMNQTIWNYTDNPNSTANDWALGVAIDHDNNITVIGYDRLPDTGGSNNNEWRIIRLGYDKLSLWNYTINISQNNDQPASVIADHNDDLIVAGFDGTFGNTNLQWRVMKFEKRCNLDPDCLCWEKCAKPGDPKHTPYTCYDFRVKDTCYYYDNCNVANNCAFNMGTDCPNLDDLCYNKYCYNALRRTCLDDTGFCHKLFIGCVLE